jgi:ParB family chromosome partitioning protein
LATRLGRSRSAVANSLRLLSLPEEARKDVDEGRLTPGHARALLSVSNERARNYLRNLILEESLSVREAEGLAATWKETGRFQPDAAFSPRPTVSAAEDDPAALSEDSAAAEWAAAPPDPAVPGERQGKSRVQSARLLDIQARIHAVFRLPVRVTGKESKGRISFAYNSREELEVFLAALEPLSGALWRGSGQTAGQAAGSLPSGSSPAPEAASSGDLP